MRNKLLLPISILVMIAVTYNCAFAKTDWKVSTDGLLTFNENCESIGETEFFNNNDIKKVIMTDSIKNMGIAAFSTCENLEVVTMSSQITSIPEAAFHSCGQLKSIEIPEKVTEIGINAFSYCSSLKTIPLPQNLEKIGVGAFQFCDLLTSVIIPDNVESISNSAFFSNKSLESIILPRNLKVIDEKAFAFCGSLQEVFIPDGTETIGANAFWNCNSLKKVYIPESITNIGEKAFYDYAPIIYGYIDSYAEKYAIEQGFKFVAIEESLYEKEREKLSSITSKAKEVVVIDDETGIKLEVNSVTVNFPDAQPFIDENNRTQIPVRAVAETLGFDVSYNDGEVTIENNERKTTLHIGKNDMIVDFGYGIECTVMDTAARIVNDRTYVPVRYIAESMGYEVVWR